MFWPLAVLYMKCLARLGASVTGIDASEENIEAAQWHASLDPAVQRGTR